MKAHLITAGIALAVVVGFTVASNKVPAIKTALGG